VNEDIELSSKVLPLISLARLILVLEDMNIRLRLSAKATATTSTAARHQGPGTVHGDDHNPSWSFLDIVFLSFFPQWSLPCNQDLFDGVCVGMVQLIDSEAVSCKGSGSNDTASMSAESETSDLHINDGWWQDKTREKLLSVKSRRVETWVESVEDVDETSTTTLPQHIYYKSTPDDRSGRYRLGS
jgi:hypothetical protein